MNLAQDIREAYRTLDLPPGAGWDEVKSAYRRLARALHPDLNPGRGGDEMARVNRAYHRLSALLAHQPRPTAADGYRPYDFETWAPRRGQRPYNFEAFQAQTPRRSARPAAEHQGPSRPAPRPASAAGPTPLAPVSGPSHATQPGGQAPAAPERTREGYRLVGLERRGGDLVYQVRVDGQPQRIVLPLRGRRPCPQCTGSGREPGGRGACPACAGRGHITSAHMAVVDLPAGWTPGQLLDLPGQGLEGGVLVQLLGATGEA